MSERDPIAAAVLAEVAARLAQPPRPAVDALAVAKRIRSGRRGATLVSLEEIRALADFVITHTEEEDHGS